MFNWLPTKVLTCKRNQVIREWSSPEQSALGFSKVTPVGECPLNKKINYSDERELQAQEEVNKKKTGLRWRARKARSLKFVDNGMILSKINMDSADQLGHVAGKLSRSKHDLQSQIIFRRIVARAESRGMVMNKKRQKCFVSLTHKPIGLPAGSKMLMEIPSSLDHP